MEVSAYDEALSAADRGHRDWNATKKRKRSFPTERDPSWILTRQKAANVGVEVTTTLAEFGAQPSKISATQRSAIDRGMQLGGSLERRSIRDLDNSRRSISLESRTSSSRAFVT